MSQVTLHLSMWFWRNGISQNRSLLQERINNEKNFSEGFPLDIQQVIIIKSLQLPTSALPTLWTLECGATWGEHGMMFSSTSGLHPQGASSNPKVEQSNPSQDRAKQPLWAKPSQVENYWLRPKMTFLGRFCSEAKDKNKVEKFKLHGENTIFQNNNKL